MIFKYANKFYREHKSIPSPEEFEITDEIYLAGGMFALSAAFFDALWHNISEYKETGVFIWEWWGITYSGGLFGAIIAYLVAYFLIIRDERHNIFFYLDIVVLGLAIAHGFGRIGCFCGGCCYGYQRG